jgi:hypothetical protein
LSRKNAGFEISPYGNLEIGSANYRRSFLHILPKNNLLVIFQLIKAYRLMARQLKYLTGGKLWNG